MAKRGTWAAGTIELSTEEGEVLAAIVVDDKSGRIVGRASAPQGSISSVELLLRAIESAAEHPRPRAIAIAGEVGRAVKEANVGIEIVSRGSPALVRAIVALQAAAAARHEIALLAAGEALIGARPWEVFDRTTGFVVDAPDLGAHEAVVFVMAPDAPGEVGGWFFVASEDDLARVASHDRKSSLRADTLALHFERSGEDWTPVLDRSTRAKGAVEAREQDVELAAVISIALADIASKQREEEGPWEIEMTSIGGAIVKVRGPLLEAEADSKSESDEGPPPQR